MMKNKLSFLLMYISFFIYSLSSFFSKIASKQDFLSFGYFLSFSSIIIIMGIYAILWQQVLKKLPLSIAMSNKPIVLVFSVLWAVLFFDETLNIKIMLGIILIIIGVLIIGVKNE